MPAKKTEDNYYRRAQYEELARTEFPPLVVFVADDGRQFTIPNPSALTDEQADEIDATVSLSDMGRAWLGDDYDAFRAAGGQSWMIGYQIRREQERVTGKKPDGTPTT